MWESKCYGALVLNHRVVLHAIDATPARWRGDAGSSPLEHPTHWLISTQVPTPPEMAVRKRMASNQSLHSAGSHGSMTSVAHRSKMQMPPGYRGVNDQFFVAQGGTFGRVARLYEYIPSLYKDAQCTFHPEHLLGYAAVAALRLELRYYEAPPPDPVAIPEPVPGFASASGREEAPCDYAAAGYHIRRHSEREGAWL